METEIPASAVPDDPSEGAGDPEATDDPEPMRAGETDPAAEVAAGTEPV